MNSQKARDTHKAAAELLKNLGFQLDMSNPRYNANSVVFKVTLTEANGNTVASEPKEARDFRAYAPMIGLQSSDLNREFMARGKKYKLVGYMPRSWKNPMLIEDANGKQYKMSVNEVKQSLGALKTMSEKEIIEELRGVECALSPETNSPS